MTGQYDSQITVLEGTAVFTPHKDSLFGMYTEGYGHSLIASTMSIALDAEASISRCKETWANHGVVYYVFKDYIGLERKLPVVAIKKKEVMEGTSLIVFVRIPEGFDYSGLAFSNSPRTS